MIFVRACIKSLLFISILSGCAHDGRDAFVNRMNSSIGKKAEIYGDDIIKYYTEDTAFTDVHSFYKGNLLYVEYNYFHRGCRIGKSFDSKKILVEWYFISELDKCVLEINWLGPW